MPFAGRKPRFRCGGIRGAGECADRDPRGRVRDAFATKERAIIEDVETDARFECYVPLAREAGFRAVHSTPILTQQDDVLGVLSVHFKRVRRPTDTEMQLADLCARHAADAMEVAKSRRALRESEVRFARFMQHLPGLAWIKDEAGRYVFANAAAQKAFQSFQPPNCTAKSTPKFFRRDRPAVPGERPAGSGE